MSKSCFIIAAVAAWLATSSPASTVAADKTAPRPNILFLLADDWAWPAASCLGTPVIQTPTFDRLVREGVLFRNAHCAAPSCSPSRAAVLTGQWHWRLEEGANLQGRLMAKFPVYPDLLEQAGYFVGKIRKGYGPGGLGDRKHDAAGPKYASFGAFLDARPKNQPFCFWFGSTQPHRRYPVDIGVKHGLDAAKVVVPPYLPDNGIVRKDICDYYYEAQEFDRQAGAAIAALEKTGELDNTLIVITGDNGWPFPRGKATLYDSGTHEPLGIRWGAKVRPGRVVEDFVSLSDLAPTFLEAAGLSVPKAMTGRSLIPILDSPESGQIDPRRDHVLTGMETHVPARALPGGGRGGYPMRSIITKDLHYIRNFRADRWPAGDPGGSPEGYGFSELSRNTTLTFADVDAGPTKAWMLLHRDEPAVKPLADLAFGKRPDRELYDLRKDPYELKNVAEDPAYRDIAAELDSRLMAELKATGDPRATGGGDQFDHYREKRGS